MRHVFAAIGSVTALWAVAVLQPVFGPLGQSPEFFVAHRADGLDLGLLIAALLVVPAVASGAVIAVAGLIGRRTQDALTAVLVGLLTGLLAAQAGYRVGLTGWPATAVVVGAVATLVAGSWVYLPVVRSYLAVLTPAALIVPLLFVMQPGMRSIWRPAGPAAAGAAVAGETPVVVVVFDELSLVSLLAPDGTLDPVRYPRLVALARDGIWFDRTTTVSEFTQWALPAIMTGRYPRPNTTPTAADHPESIFTAFAPRYRTHAHEWGVNLCPASLCEPVAVSRAGRLGEMLSDVRVVAEYSLLPPSARAGLPSLTGGWANFDGDADSDNPDATRAPWTDLLESRNRIADARAFVEAISADEAQPVLYFLHTMLTHHPTRWVPSGQIIANRVQIPPRLRGPNWSTEPWPTLQWYQGHLLQAGLADTIVGWIVDRLKSQGLYDRALIVITADHGVSFRPGDAMRYLTDTNGGDILPVPFIMKLPAAPGVPRNLVDSRNAQTIDILPTIADALHVSLPWAVDGRSALGPPGGPEKRMYVKRATQLRRFTADEVARMEREALARQSTLFSSGPWPSPRVPGFPVDLVGRSVDSVPTVEDTGESAPVLSNPLLLEHVDLAAPELPVEVVGSVAPAGWATDDPAGIAVAVNGTVVAMTTTVKGRADWYALIPPASLRQGANRLEAFLLDRSRPGALVRRGPSSRDPNLALGGAALWGVKQSGFHRTEQARGTFFRWTNGHAVMDVPIDPARPPGRLTIATLFSGRRHTHVDVRVDGCQVLETVIPSREWSRAVPLDQCVPRGYWARVEVITDTHVPGKGDPRRLGVALSRVTLE